MNKRIHIICVLYNDVIGNIASLQNFFVMQDKYGLERIRIHIYDNSSESYVETNRKLMMKNTDYKNRILYIENGGNIGLSKTYNKALREISDVEDWIMFADDDTDFSVEYLNTAISDIIDGCEENIVTGLIRASNRILGPTQTDTWRINNHPLSKTGTYDDIYCINSGLFIKRAIYDMTGLYDEEMFLDMIDFYLMEKLRQHGLNLIRVVDGLIQQTFSGDETTYTEGMSVRYEIFKKDFSLYCKHANKSWLYKQIIVKRRALRILLMKVRGKVE